MAVGKDEVGGSNPPSSSKNPPKSFDFGGFLYLLNWDALDADYYLTTDATRQP